MTNINDINEVEGKQTVKQQTSKLLTSIQNSTNVKDGLTKEQEDWMNSVLPRFNGTAKTNDQVLTAMANGDEIFEALFGKEGYSADDLRSIRTNLLNPLQDKIYGEDAANEAAQGPFALLLTSIERKISKLN